MDFFLQEDSHRNFFLSQGDATQTFFVTKRCHANFLAQLTRRCQTNVLAQLTRRCHTNFFLSRRCHKLFPLSQGDASMPHKLFVPTHTEMPHKLCHDKMPHKFSCHKEMPHKLFVTRQVGNYATQTFLSLRIVTGTFSSHILRYSTGLGKQIGTEVNCSRTDCEKSAGMKNLS
jgi:hypothetical protein